MESQLPMVITCLIIHTLLTSFPSISHFSTLLIFHPGIDHPEQQDYNRIVGTPGREGKNLGIIGSVWNESYFVFLKRNERSYNLQLNKVINFPTVSSVSIDKYANMMY